MKITLLCLFLIVILGSVKSDPSSQLTQSLHNIVIQKSLRGIQLQVTQNGDQIYYHSQGTKNDRLEPIDQNTVFRIASCSKSFSAVAIMQLVEQGKVRLNDSLSSILGFEIKNPYYPQTPITVQMILSHTSSIAEPQVQYDQFLQDTDDQSRHGDVPHIKELFKGGKYYNQSIFSPNRKPGQHFYYSNFGFILAGTVIEAVSRQRFDLYMRENILKQVSQGLGETATYAVSGIRNISNLGTIYEGDNGKWVDEFDNRTKPVPESNLSLYRIGTNAGIFAPQGSIRASVRHMNNYVHIYMNKGVLKNGMRLLSEQSVNEVLKPRYQYHGTKGGLISYNLYGLGIFTTSYLQSDILIQHQVVRGHTGAAYGLVAGYHFWKNYSFSYIINGALNGYGYDPKYIYEPERIAVHRSIDEFVQKIQAKGKLQTQ